MHQCAHNGSWPTPIEMLLFPVTNTRHELNSQQRRESKNCGTLPLRIGVNSIWLDLRFVFLQVIENVMALPGSARGEPTHQSDLAVREQVIAKAAITPISNVILRHQVLRIQVPLHPVC